MHGSGAKYNAKMDATKVAAVVYRDGKSIQRDSTASALQWPGHEACGLLPYL